MLFTSKRFVGQWDVKCSFCGQFIAIKDLEDGKATYEMTLPDSEVTDETYEGECKKCKTTSLSINF